MTFINSSIVLLAKHNVSFSNPDSEGATEKTYPNGVSMRFTNNKLVFQVNERDSLLPSLKKQTIDYCDKHQVYGQVQATGINFIIADVNLEYDNVLNTYINHSFPKFKGKELKFLNISFQYDVSEDKKTNIKLAKALDAKGVKKAITIFDINIHYKSSSSADDIKNITENITKDYNEMKKFVEDVHGTLKHSK